MKGAFFYLFDYIAGKGSLLEVVVQFFASFVVIFLCFPFHEFAHAWMAHKLGDDTAERAGRLTLNPLAHIDPMGALCILFCNIGWAKPTPVSLNRCRKVTIRKADILVSLAGPVSNIILSLLIMIIYKIIIVTTGEGLNETGLYIIMGLSYAASINAFLAVFNLLPVPPFDGYALIQGILPRKAAIFVEQNARIINFVVFMLLISRVLSVPLGLLSEGIMWLLDMATKFIC